MLFLTWLKWKFLLKVFLIMIKQFYWMFWDLLLRAANNISILIIVFEVSKHWSVRLWYFVFYSWLFLLYSLRGQTIINMIAFLWYQFVTKSLRLLLQWCVHLKWLWRYFCTSFQHCQENLRIMVVSEITVAYYIYLWCWPCLWITPRCNREAFWWGLPSCVTSPQLRHFNGTDLWFLVLQIFFFFKILNFKFFLLFVLFLQIMGFSYILPMH